MTDVPIIVIAYPAEWLCLSKFQRKLHKLFSNLKQFAVLYPHDEQGLIEKTFAEDQRVLAKGLWLPMTFQPNYAVIFDDQRSLEDVKSRISELQIDSRHILVKVTRIVNIEHESYDIYIGRGSGFGNPYAIGVEGDDRDEVIRKFQYDFDRDYLKDHFKRRLLAHQGKTLGCHCKPLACHGDVLATYLNSYDDGL